MILYNRQVTKAEVEALAIYFTATGWPVSIVVQNSEIASHLQINKHLKLNIIDFSGQFASEKKSGIVLPAKTHVSAAATTFRHLLKSRIIRHEALRLPVLWHGLWRDLRLARRLMADLKPACLFVADDRTPRPDMCFLRAAREVGIPSIVFSYAASSLESDIHLRNDKLPCHLNYGTARWLKRWLARRFPNHLCPKKGNDLLFFGVWDMLALAAVGLADTNPWFLGGGECSSVTVLGP
ncbi:hypothetical protein, partial [Magnetospirillum fulvum]|uniref:hypothetical protein n=1 Tax=Magnetospirillum fulvum TaxID=1082 RepID=UPI001E4ABD2A